MEFEELIIQQTIEILNIVSSEEFSDEYLDGEYIYPCEDEELKDRLLGEGGAVHVDEYLLDHDPDFLAKQIKFRNIIESGPFNPYSSYQLNDYFIKTKTYKELDKIIFFKKRPELVHNIVHIGDRGAGKTALQNCWLYRNNELLEENLIFWVRCDGFKLYRLWLEFEPVLDGMITINRDDTSNIYDENHMPLDIKIENLVNIEEYIDIQLVYVFSKYILSLDRKLFQNIISTLEKERPQFGMPATKALHHKVKTDLYDRIVELNNTILKEESNRGRTYSYAFDRVMRISQKSRQIEKHKWIYTSKALQAFLYKHRFWVLRIVDGIDNVHINNPVATKFYKHMLKEASKFIKTKPLEKNINYIAVRERTFDELLITNPLIKNTGYDYSYIKKIYHDTSPIQEVLSKRYDYAEDLIFSENDTYGEIALNVVSSMPKTNNSFNHNNIRSFLHNKMSLISLVHYRILQLGGNRSHIPYQVHKLSQRNRFLNGRLFLNTKKQWPELNIDNGVCRMNMFYFDNDSHNCQNIHNWHGMCKARILQILKYNGSVSEINIIKFLNLSLSYSAQLIKDNISDLRAFGLIDTKYIHEIFYVISRKGENELKYSFLDFDTLYYYALDTFIPSKFIELKLINSHTNKFCKKTDYPLHSFTTAITFLLFLRKVNTIENEKHKLYKKESSKQSNINYLPNMHLPLDNKKCYTEMRSSIKEKIISIYNDKESANLEAYISKIKTMLL